MNTVSLPLPLTWLQPLDFPHKLGICDRLFGSSISCHGVCWVQTGAGIPWKLDLANPVHRWIVYGKYDGAAFLNWAKRTLPSNGIVVDSGANIGQILLYIAQWVPKGKVLAFEPGKEQADWLADCLAAHPQLPVELIRLGLGATPSTAHLFTAGAGFVHGYWSRISDSGEGDAIQIVRLGDELAARAIAQVDLWKLDVEGYEVEALQGAEDYLANQRIRALYVEISQQQGQQVQDYLASFGYQGYLFQPNGSLQPVPKTLPVWTNALFLPASLSECC
ncbi:MAG: FkbM family methyltransferase [Cyanobacteria bacterium]|nr:FkbM family methyltransferase [Cyanobacteriota bacterium]MDW8200419.1 FkbM family methyltransferase [Cyanobacteriota bacterium SKYGB_h_bin112]